MIFVSYFPEIHGKKYSDGIVALGWRPEGKRVVGTPRNVLEKVSGGQKKKGGME